MFSYTTHIRVRYAETDKMGFVYYGNYSAYYEIVRVEAIRSLGLTYKDLEDQGCLMPVVENHSRYLRPAKYDDLLEIRTFVDDKPDKKIKFRYEIYNQEGVKIHTGETILVFLDAQSGKTMPIPQNLSNVLSPFFDE